MSKRKSTQTSAFGSPGRAGHDSSAFYAGKLYDDQKQEKEVQYIENPIPAGSLDHIFCHSAEAMTELPDCSVHLMVTSPPYNVGKEYDQDLSLEDYLAFLRACLEGNVARAGPRRADVHQRGQPGAQAVHPAARLHRRSRPSALGFLMRGEIIWNKAASASPSTAWGSWKSAGNPTLRDVHEYILVFCKGTFKRQNPDKRENTISRDEFLEYNKSVWNFPAESARKVGHPAPFPVELPRRLIQLYTFEGEVVLDPFMGSGQTAIAALKSNRHYVGYETEGKYVALANQRIKKERNHENPPALFNALISPALDTRRSSYLIPNIDIDPAKVSIMLISEAAPENPADHYYAGQECPLRPDHPAGFPGCRGEGAIRAGYSRPGRLPDHGGQVRQDRLRHRHRNHPALFAPA